VPDQNSARIQPPGFDERAADRDFLIIYKELRKLARSCLSNQPAGHILQTTALVHEAFLKLRQSPVTNDRAHFMRLAAEAMRQVLIDHARAANRLKRGGGRRSRQELTDVACLAVEPDAELILSLEEALCRLEIAEPRAARVIKLRFYVGLTAQETAEVTGLSLRTVNREWRFARAWLYQALEGRLPESDSDGAEGKSTAPGERS
jgi:RNA polymerase sigma factor (TIGR02999 family)